MSSTPAWLARLALAGITGGVLGTACGGGALSCPEPRKTAPALLFASHEIAGDFLLQQRIDFRGGGREGVIDAAVQNACGELTIILFTPYGTPGTIIRQRGWEVDVTSRHGAELPFAPERILLDVQRTYFVPLPDPSPRKRAVERRLGGRRMEETWVAGRLVERVFHPSCEDGDRVHIRYPHGATAARPPTVAVLASERFGYRLEVTTLSRVPVECGPRADLGFGSIRRW